MDYQSVYDTLKRLEGTMLLPETEQTLMLGTLNVTTGAFTWGVRTVLKTTQRPPLPNGKPVPPVTTKVGVVSTRAVNLHFKINLEAKGHADTSKPQWGVTTSPFPLAADAGSALVINAGMIASAMQNGEVTTPSINFNLPSGQTVEILLYVLRPPVLGMGAFTLPALPVTIVYAPPQGKDKLNTSSYTETTTVTRNFTSAVTTGSSTKTAQAYTPDELVGKLAGAIAAAVAVVGGSPAPDAPSVSGGVTEILKALTGSDAQSSTADAVKQLGTNVASFGTALNSLPMTTSSQTSGTTTENDFTTTLSFSHMSSYPADNPLGPGAGDRMVMLRDVRVAWTAVNGQLGVSLLGYHSVAAHSMNDMQQSLATGTPLNTHDPALKPLDPATLSAMLALDPFITTSLHKGPPAGGIIPPKSVIGPPRFVPADPAEYGGSGTPGGDQQQIKVNSSSSTKNVTVNMKTTITDFKPSWFLALFGSKSDNVSTESTATYTGASTTEVIAAQETVCTFTFFTASADIGDTYGVKFFYDTLFHTYLAVDANSPLLHGGTVAKA